MTYRVVPLSEQVTFSPGDATVIIMNAYTASGANLRATAERLAISHRTLRRYIDKLDLGPQIKLIQRRASREGWRFCPSGRPTTKETTT